MNRRKPTPAGGVALRRRNVRLRGAPSLDQRRMREALALAQRAAAEGEAPVGAVLYRHGQRIGVGRNTRESRNDPLGHAEVQAIQQAAEALDAWRLNGCTLYVTLEPCPMCAGAIVNARLGRLVYGAADPKAGAVDTLFELCSDPRLNHRVAVTAGVLADECGQVLKRFFRRRRREKKRTKVNRLIG